MPEGTLDSLPELTSEQAKEMVTILKGMGTTVPEVISVRRPQARPGGRAPAEQEPLPPASGCACAFRGPQGGKPLDSENAAPDEADFLGRMSHCGIW